MSKFEKFMSADRPFLTDGGMETWLFFQQNFEAPEFAAIVLMNDDQVRLALQRYFSEFLSLAQKAGTGFVLDTNTWRGCTSWAEKLGMSEDALLGLSRDAVEFANSIRSQWVERVPGILLNGVIGPSGDGYSAGDISDAKAAQDLHAPQVAVLAESGVDMISAITITNVEEAIGITRAAKQTGLPVVISFTVETDGCLPAGDALGAAIMEVDAATDSGPAYYMINCAHPDHFRDTIALQEPWTRRVCAIRANASRMSHEELDNSQELDEGDPDEFGLLHAELAQQMPQLRVVGGCCGTDHRHVGRVSAHLHG